MDLETEKKWFVESSWEHQKTAEYVIITLKVKNTAVMKVTIEYFKSIGIKIDDSKPEFYHRHLALTSIVINLVNKEMTVQRFLDYRHFVDNKISFQAFPSQVLEFLEQNKGRLTGKKFGL
jgi:hypothetical protein